MGRGLTHRPTNPEPLELPRLAARGSARHGAGLSYPNDAHGSIHIDSSLIHLDPDVDGHRHQAHDMVASAHSGGEGRPSPPAFELQHQAPGAGSEWGLDRRTDTYRGPRTDRSLGRRRSAGEH